MNKDSKKALENLDGIEGLSKYCHHYCCGNSLDNHIGCEDASDDLGAPCMFLGVSGECRVLVQIRDGLYD